MNLSTVEKYKLLDSLLRFRLIHHLDGFHFNNCRINHGESYFDPKLLDFRVCQDLSSDLQLFFVQKTRWEV